MGRNEASLIATLAYSDIFDYPLTKAEMWKFLSTSHPIKFSSFTNMLENSQYIKEKDGFYYLPKRSMLPRIRKERYRWSEKKLHDNKKIFSLLSKIPTVQLIAVSGSLALFNGEKDADIDLFVITKSHTLWITRLMLLLLLELKKKRRKRIDADTRGKICVNMLIDENHLSFPKKRHDIYTAHEIAQMRILFSREGMQEKFFNANPWVRVFLPNSIKITKTKLAKHRKSPFVLLDPIAKWVQLWYMHAYRTKEEIKKGFAAFHPEDYRHKTIRDYEMRKKRYGI